MTIPEPTVQTRILHSMGDQCLQLSDLAGMLMLSNDAVQQSAKAMILRGLLERISRGCYQLTEAGKQAKAEGLVIISGPKLPSSGPRKTVDGSLRQRAWNVMRIKHRFTVPDLVAVASTAADRSPVITIQVYLLALKKAGFVAPTGAKIAGTKPGSQYRVYRLTQDTGDVAPSLIRKETVLFDHNTNTEVAL